MDLKNSIHLSLRLINEIRNGTLTVRGEEVPLTPREICEFYDVSYYENDFLDSTGLDRFRDMDDVMKYLT